MATPAYHQPPPTTVQMPPGYSEHTDDRDIHNDVKYGCMSYLLIVIGYTLAVLLFPFLICVNLKVVQEYQRAVVFRLGRIRGAKGPEIIFALPCVDVVYLVDLRIVSFQVPP
uniref:PHB domain-containing protein n=1 Tax=Panagrellus redivivus TaxID=6233 RepID=A0A7E4UWD2_PANRE